jgi:hypothetical protein
MTPDELDAAIRQELRSAARLAPDPGPVRVRVLRAAEVMASQELPRRGLRAWTVPLLAAAAVLVALVLTTATQVLRSEGNGTGGTNGPAGSLTPPAVSASTTPAGPIPTPPTSTAGARSAPSPSGTAGPSGTPARSGGGQTSARTSTSSRANPTPHDWFRGLDVATLPHTPGLCPGGLPVDSVPGMGAPSIPVAGESAPLWLVPVTCVGATGEGSPRPVEVFRYSPDGPQLVQTLAYQAGDPRSIVVTALSVGAGGVTLSESGYHDTYDDQCCRSLRYTQTYIWNSGHFEAGPQQDAVLPCTEGQLTISGSWLPAPDGTTTGGFLLVYTNHADGPCELTGYPRAWVTDAAHQSTDAAPTPAGPHGGLTPGSEAPRVVLFGSVVGSAVVEWGIDQQAAARCWTMATVASTPPGGLTETSDFGNQPLVCDPQVHPVVYGSSGLQKARGDR